MTSRSWIPRIDKDSKQLAQAIAEALETDIARGILKPNDLLPPQRELADRLGVNLSTITRAFRLCQLKGLIYGVVGSGTFISPDARVPLTLIEQDSAEIIDLGQVLPLYSLDQSTANQCRDFLQTMDFARLLRYTEPQGERYHRAVGAEWLQRFKLNPEPEEIIITAGSQNALANCLLSLFKYGDRIAVDTLTYPGFKSLAALYGIRLVPIEMTAQGMNIETLEKVCKTEPIKGIYLMPEVHNPTTRSMSQSQREHISKIIKRYDLILLEDDAYAYTGDRDNLPITTYLPQHGIYLGGTSKLLGPGFRISFVQTPERFRESLKKGLLHTIWMASPITAELVCRLITSGRAEEVIAEKRKEAQKRNQLALKILGEYNPTHRTYGFFQWLYLPENWHGQGWSFEILAREAGIQVFCGEKFVVGSGITPPAIRISLSGPADDQTLKQGLLRLKHLLAKDYQTEYSQL